MKISVGNTIVELEDGDRICARLAGQMGFEPESRLLFAAMARGGTVLDIGAYSGLYAIAAAKQGARVFAFEPLPVNVALLKRNVMANGCYVNVYEAALGDKVGTATLTYNPRVKYTSGATLNKVENQTSFVTCEVNVLTIDMLNLSELNFVKMDVEGHEAFVIRGGLETLSRFKPTLLVEVLNSAALASLVELLPNYKVAAMFDRRNALFVPN